MDYKASGVDIDAGNETVRRIRSLARSTFTAGVLSDIGSFGGLFRIDRHAADRIDDGCGMVVLMVHEISLTICLSVEPRASRPRFTDLLGLARAATRSGCGRHFLACISRGSGIELRLAAS